MYRIALMSLALVVGSGIALAQTKTPYTAAEMKALLAKGLLVNSSDLEGGRYFTGRVNLDANGQLSGTLTPAGQQPIALSGRWRLDGARLCRTLAPIEPKEVCETWLKSGNRQATIQVGGKETSINRW